MEKYILEEYASQGWSSHQIAKAEGKSQTTIRYWLKKYGIKTRFKHRDGRALVESCRTRKTRTHRNLITLDWNAVQQFYNQGKSLKETGKTFSVGMVSLYRAAEQGLIRLRIKEETRQQAIVSHTGKRHSAETRKRLSLIRKKYLHRTGRQAWKTVDKHRSVPCEKLKMSLLSMKIAFEEEYQPLHHKQRFFRLDIAFPALKFAVEINGRQHYDSDGNLAPYYQDRHDLITAEGWEIIEVPYQHIFQTKRYEELLEFIRKKVVQAGGVEPTT